MDLSEECKKCNPPYACVISCPNTDMLDRMASPFCIALVDVLDDPTAEFEILVDPEHRDTDIRTQDGS